MYLGAISYHSHVTAYSVSKTWSLHVHLSLVMRKPVFVISNQVRFKLACSATEASQRLEILYTETRGLILYGQQIKKVLISLRGCPSWSVSLLFKYAKSRFWLGEAHLWPIKKFCCANVVTHPRICFKVRKPTRVMPLSNLKQKQCFLRKTMHPPSITIY